MKEFLLIVGFFVLCFVTTSFAQEKPSEKLFEVRAIVKNQDKIALAGSVLTFVSDKMNTNIVSDENGAFVIKLPIGKYKITANTAISKNFVAFIETFDSNLNPTDFDLIIETDEVCCSSKSDGSVTEVIKYTAPPYPPAAKAVRAMGEVVISVKIAKEGNVISAQAISGHPLLRKTAEKAAEQWLFSSDEILSEREGKIVFAFLESDKENPVSSFIKPNRLVVFGKPIVISSSY